MKAPRAPKGSKGLDLKALLRKPCRCLARVCFQQFASLEESVVGARAEFQQLTREKKDDWLKQYFI